LLKEQRRGLHARIVDALEALYADRRGEHVERLAHHALGAELWFEAVAYLQEAAAKAASRSANREAVTFLEQALGALGHLAESRETFAQAIDVRLDLRPPLLQLGRLDEIKTLSEEAARMAAQIGDEARQARAYSYLINYHYLRGEPARALEYGERCLAIAERLGDRMLVSIARRYLGHAYHALGQLYVEKYFSPRTKQRYEKLTDEIFAAFGDRIRNLTWMSQPTKDRALVKLAAVTKKVELVSGVLILPQRQTGLIAKQAAEVDILSGGRVRLGVGVHAAPMAAIGSRSRIDAVFRCMQHPFEVAGG